VARRAGQAHQIRSVNVYCNYTCARPPTPFDKSMLDATRFVAVRPFNAVQQETQEEPPAKKPKVYYFDKFGW